MRRYLKKRAGVPASEAEQEERKDAACTFPSPSRPNNNEAIVVG